MANNNSAKYEAVQDNVEVCVENGNRARQSDVSAASGARRRSSRWPLPELFERSSRKIWNPAFDSRVLEKFYAKCTMVHVRRRFRHALMYVALSTIGWIIYCAVLCFPTFYFVGLGAVLALALLLFGLTFVDRLYARAAEYMGLVLSLVLVCLVLGHFIMVDYSLRLGDYVSLSAGINGSTLVRIANATTPSNALTSVASYSFLLDTLLLLFAVLPVRLLWCVVLCVGSMVGYEVLLAICLGVQDSSIIAGHVLVNIGVLVICVALHLSEQARRRSTFWKMGEACIARHELSAEKQAKETMIRSLMPEKVAREVMAARSQQADEAAADDDEDDDDSPGGKKRRAAAEKGAIRFRMFNMSQMVDVSILFADIVGFTKMSSGKTAPELVSLLGDLFGRFDTLCASTGCEKVATLGDCYYSVAGCPEPRPDHANCSVRFGLAMCKAIQQFDRDHNEEVNMRVGVHTGTVLCGIVGSRRFKFDVFSNDVTLANMMESSGYPGRVHISESTLSFLGDSFVVEPGQMVADIRQHKVLIEYYDEKRKCYSIKHTQDTQMLKTYFVVCPSGEEAPSDQPKLPPEFLAASSGHDDHAGGHDDHAEEHHDDGHHDEKHDESHALEKLGEQQPLLGAGPDDTPLAVAVDEEAHADGHAGARDSEATTSSRIKSSASGANDAITVEKMLSCMQEDSTFASGKLFYELPVSQLTLHFRDAALEQSFRTAFGRTLEREIGDLAASKQHCRPLRTTTFSTPKTTVFIDSCVATIVFVCAAVATLIVIAKTAAFVPTVIVTIVGAIICILLLIAVTISACHTHVLANRPSLHRAFKGAYSSVGRNLIGVLVLCLPSIVVLVATNCGVVLGERLETLFYCWAVLFTLLHFTNFSVLTMWARTACALLVGAVVVLLILLQTNFCCLPRYAFEAGLRDAVTVAQGGSASVWASILAKNKNYTTMNWTAVTSAAEPGWFNGVWFLRYELILDVLLLLVAIGYLNREAELAHRLGFHCAYEAEKDVKRRMEEKESSDWLLLNIIPHYIREELQSAKRYSRDLKDVGVIFACIANFSEFYDESFEGGREYLRVLNELIGDFEELFDEPRYRDVEKIKTIGACFMGASGLNMDSRATNRNPRAHLYALMDFSVDLLRVLREFNKAILSFDFKLKIGYNFGEVTAGVIGTTKLLYDIWGDTVNVASRMYSTGSAGKIQVTADVARYLSNCFEFEYRGKTFVKGKGDLDTYLFVRKKPGATWS